MKGFSFRMLLLVLFVSILFHYEEVFASKSVNEAIAWAESQVGSNSDTQCSTMWAYNCMHFCGHAYGIFPSLITDAITGWETNNGTFGLRHDDANFASVPRGALVFFGTNLYSAGHVGISLGNGEMIHAWTSGVVKDSISSLAQYYIGWRWPSAWTGTDVEPVPINIRTAGNIGWYPPNKSCVNAERWYRVEDVNGTKQITQMFQNGNICLGIDYVGLGIWYDVIYGNNDLAQMCTQ